MAKQTSYIRMRGDMGGITFFERDGNFYARQTRTVNPDAIKSDPAFERTRENNSEFSRAAKAAKLILTAFRSVTAGATDGRVYSRLMREVMRGVKADPVNDRGQRTFVDGEPAFVKGFDFNSAGELTAVCKAQLAPAIDRAAGTVGVAVQSFVPARMLLAPVGATHFRMVCAGAELDFRTDEYILNVSASAELKLGNDSVSAQTLECLVPPASTHPVFAVFGVEFVQEVNKKYYARGRWAMNITGMGNE